MRVRSALAVLCILGLSAAAPARAGVDGAVIANQQLSVSGFNMLTGDSIYLFVNNRTGGTAAGTSATQVASYQVSGGFRVCTPGCVYTEFATQQVSPSALSFDPLGNSGTFRASLIRSSNTPGPNIAVDLSFTRPATFGQCLTCMTPNGWVDPTSNSAGARADGAPGIFRSRYTIAGTFDGQPAPLPATGPFGYINDTFATALGLSVAVVAP